MHPTPHYLRETLSYAEIHEALVTGTRPIYFQENAGTPIWGAGTLFVAQWKGMKFAITAKHVIKNCGANPKHTRLLFPGYKVALPISGALTFNLPKHDNREELEDIFIFKIDHKSDLDDEELEWYAWNMSIFWKPAYKLERGQQIFAVGFPSTDDRYDWERQKIKESPLIAVGMLGVSEFGEGIYTIDCAEFDCDLSGISGGPVFAQFDGLFHYVGMIIRGGAEAKKIHFIDSIYITFVLNEAVKSSN